MDPECLTLPYWNSITSQSQLEQQVNHILSQLQQVRYEEQQNTLELLGFLILFIRDETHGLGNRDLSRWLLLKLEQDYPSLTYPLIRKLPVFGSWNDLNTILLETNNRLEYATLRGLIIDTIKTQFVQDLNNAKCDRSHLISNLVRYIGKERRALDRRTGFADRKSVV